MPKSLRYTFAVHIPVAAVVGALLLFMPGRFLGWLGWEPIDPIASRLLGAAFLAFAWGSYRGWRATEWAQVAILVEVQAILDVLACLGLLRHLLVGHWPVVPWAFFGLFLAFALAWIAALARHRT